MAPKFWCSGRFMTPSVVKTARSDSDVLSLRENPFGHFVSRSRTGDCDPEHRDCYATGMMIVVLRETGWAGVVNENSLGAELVRLSGHSEGLFWLGERKDSGKGDAFPFSVANFMAHFHEPVSLYCVLCCDCGRSGGLGFASFDFRFRWSSGGPLLCSFRKRVF